MTIYNPYGGDPAVFHSQAWWVERFNAALGEEAARRDIAVAAVYERFRNNERALTWMPVDFHANNRGHRAIAEGMKFANHSEVELERLQSERELEKKRLT